MVSDSELFMEGFSILRKDRTRHGGGVALYIRETLPFKHLSQMDSNLEALWIKLQMKNVKSGYVCVIYRPPNSPPTFFDELNDVMHNVIDNADEIILLGDLNCDMCSTKADPLANKLQTVMSGYLFDQLIDIPTRITSTSNTIIDHIFTTDTENHLKSGVFEHL